MDESKILSTDEVDALLKAAQEKENDLSKLINSVNSHDEAENSINFKAMANTVELTWSECERLYSAFIRKKVNVRHKESKFGKLADCLSDKQEKHIYSIFQLNSSNDYCLVVIDLPFLHQMINALYGGVINTKEQVIEAPGNIGLIVSEKISSIALDGFCSACKEYGDIIYERVKTITLVNLINKISMDEDIHELTYKVHIGDLESDITLMFPIRFLAKFLPPNDLADEEQKKKNMAWRATIENQVVDSNIKIIASLPEILLKTKDLVTLKDGDLITIGDPTAVDVYLNDVKLFCATAGQANGKRIIKIIGER